jgi:hypothetical protein
VAAVDLFDGVSWAFFSYSKHSSSTQHTSHTHKWLYPRQMTH